MNMAETLLSPVYMYNGNLELTVPVNQHTELPAVPVLVKIGSQHIGTFGSRYCCGSIVGGGPHDGRDVKINIDVSEYLGSVIPCGLTDPVAGIARPMEVAVGVNTRDGNLLQDTLIVAESALVYSYPLTHLYDQHRVIVNDLFDTFRGNHLDVMSDVDIVQKRLRIIRKKFALRRAPHLDERCEKGLLAWYAGCRASKRFKSDKDRYDLGYFLSKGHGSQYKVAPAILNGLLSWTYDQNEIWALPADRTHTSFQVVI